MKKRVLSLFMALALCLTLLPTAAWATENTSEPSTQLTEPTPVPQEPEIPGQPEDTKTPDQPEEPSQDEEPPAAEAVAPVGEVSETADSTHKHYLCGGDTCNKVGDHEDTETTFTEWTDSTSLPTTKGSYYLTQSVSGSWTVPMGEVNLCLNGQTISGSITVGRGATLTLTDCSNSGRVQGGVTVNGGKFELYSGTITGGVQVGIKGGTYQTGSSFTMYGGAITGNKTDSGSGGGVFLVGTTNHTDPPSFTMHGGTISNNTAGASDGGGGGVYVGEKCSFTMDGGTITGNTATNGNGGGIYIHFNAGNVSISNATITDNKASATGNTSYGHGGGIYSERGVTVKGVTITGNNSTFEGGGIYGKGAITLTDATVTDNNRYDVYYGGQENSAPELTVSGLVKAGYYANEAWKLPILVSGELSENSVIHVGVREGIKLGAIAEPASGVTLRAENFKADAADSETSLGKDGKVYLVPCTHEMDDTGYTCKKCKTQFDARVGDSAYYQTLTKAFDAARDSTVTLLRDVTLTGNCSAAYNSPATLDLNGKTVSSEKYDIRVGGGNKSNTLTVKDSGTGGGTQALTVKFLVYSNGTLAVDNSYTGEISRVELQAGGALERFGGEIGELVLSNAAAGSTSTGYGLKLWKGNANACTIGKFTDNNKSKSLTVKDLLGTDYAKCELYGENSGTWSVVDKSTKIAELTGYTAYKVQFPECVHQCADDSNPVCSVCNKKLYTKITAQSTDGTTKTAYFTADSALEHGYAEAIQTLNGWSAAGCTEPTLTLLRDMDVFNTSMPLTGTLTLEGGTHTAKNVTVAENADVTFASGSYRGATINGTATVKEGVTFTSTVTVNGTLNAKGGTFNGSVEFNGSSIANISGGSFTSDRVHGGVQFLNSSVTGTISGGTFVFAWFYTTKVKLSGGTFTTIKTNGDLKLADLLAEGAAYYGASDNQAVTNDGVNTLENVKVVSHTHNGGTDGKGICSVCKKQMAAALTVGGKTSWYAAFATAIEAANAADGAKTITLYQDVNGYAGGQSTTYELTRGPVTLATGGKSVTRANLTAKGISLTVTGSNGGFNVTVEDKDAKLTVNDKDTKLAIVTAQNGGKLSLSNGTFSRVAVKDDGSSASLSGGSYGEITSDTGYVKPYALLAKGYAYKKTTDNKWLPNANSISEKVTVEKAPYVVKNIYPNSNEGYTGNSAFATDGNITLTAVIAPETEGVTYYWWELFNESDNDWTTQFSKVNTATHTGGQSKTLSISDLPENSIYQYRVDVRSDNGYQCYSEPFTVTRHQHSWTYTASGATITAKCSQCDASGGSVTIAAPAELTYSGEGKPATVTASSDWQGPAASGITISYIKTGKYSQQLENGARPTNAGTYTASITLGEVTASVEYTIEKATPHVKSWMGYPRGWTFMENTPIADPTELIIANGTFEDITRFEWYNASKNADHTYTEGAKLDGNPTDAGDYIIKAVFEGSNNVYAATDKFGLTIGKAPHANNGVSIEVPLTVYPASGEYIYDVDIAKALKNIPHGGGLEPNTTYGGISTNVNFVKSTKWDNGKLYVTMRPLANITGTTLGSITVNLTSKNYTVVPVVVNITLQPKQEVPDISVSMDNWTYGEKAKMPRYDMLAGVEAEVTYAAKDTNDFSTTVPTDAGKYTVKVQYETTTEIHIGTANFTIAPKTLTKDDLTYSGPISKVYDGNTNAPSGLTVSVKPGSLVGSDTLAVSGTLKYNSANVNEAKQIIFTPTAITTGNYALAATEMLTITGATITQADQAPLTVTSTAATYGADLALTVSGGTGDGAVSYTVTNGTGEATIVDGSTLHPAKAGQVSVTATKAGGDNYKDVTSAAKEITIGRADYNGTASKTVNIVKGRSIAQTGTLTAADFFPEGQMPVDAAIDSVTPSYGTIIESIAVDGTNHKLDYVSKTNIATASEESYTVTIAATNYKDIEAKLTFHPTDKLAQDGFKFENGNVTKTYGDEDFTLTATGEVKGSTVTYESNAPAVAEVDSATGKVTIKGVGTAVITAKASATAEYDAAAAACTLTVKKKPIAIPAADATVFTYNGTEQTYALAEDGAYTITGNKQTNANETGYSVTATLKDTVNTQWADGTTANKTYTFVIGKAVITVKAKDQTAYVGDKAPALGADSYTVSGLVGEEKLTTQPTVKYVGADGSEIAPDMTKTGEVKILASGAAASDNYTIRYEDGKLTVSARPSSGSGGSSSGGSSSSSDRDTSSSGTIKTETTKNNDGSVTKTETKKDGTVIETTTGKDGSTVKTETKKDGSSVTENKAADGSTGTVKTDKNGQTEAKTALSNKAIEDAKKSGEPVKAPVEVKASRDSSTAPTVKVELPKGTGETKVEIPVTNVKPGTVAVLVHADGTEEIVKNSLPTEDGIQLTINGGATVKIVDNSKGFIDTQDHWAKDAIDFVSARGLVNGMSATIYAPDASTTRAQLWTILARQNNADLTGGATWFENAQNWAKAKGISDGANPNGTINRAQMVTMLWRAMGQSAAASGASFADVPADSYYAQAVAWAVENGITAGVGNGRFDPNSTCTRGQIATFLWRTMAE